MEARSRHGAAAVGATPPINAPVSVGVTVGRLGPAPVRTRVPILLRHRPATERRALEWHAFFALELPPRDGGERWSLPERLAAQAMLLTRFTPSDLRVGIGARRLEVRYLARPGAKVAVALLGGVSGTDRRAVRSEAQAFVASVVRTLAQARPSIAVKVPRSTADVARWRRPFAARYVAELDRAPVGIERQDVAAWGAVSGEAFIDALCGVSAPTLLSICVARAEDGSVVESVAHLEASSLRGSGGSVTALLEDFRSSEAARRVAGLRSAAFEVRVSAASAAALDEALLTTFAAEAGGAGRFGIASVLDDVALRGARLPSWRRARSAARSGDSAAATENLLWQRADPWGDASQEAERLSDLRETAGLFALPVKSGRPGEIARIPVEVPPSSEGARLGSALRSTTPVLVSEAARLRHMWILGKTGTGKSTLKENLFLQAINDPMRPPVIVFEAHGIDRVLGLIPENRRDDVIVFDPADAERPVTLNPLAVAPDELAVFIRNFIELLYSLFDPLRQGIMGPMFEHNLRNATLLVAAKSGSTLVDVMRVLSDDDTVGEFVPYVTDPQVLAWVSERERMDEKQKAEQRTYYVSKLGPFVTDAVVRRVLGAARPSVSIDDMLAHGRILVVDLDKGDLGEISRFLAVVILPMIQRVVMRRPQAERSRPVHIFIDEFQNFASPALAALLAEGRKFGCGLVLSNQHAAQLPSELFDALLGNVANIVAFRVGVKDAPMIGAAIGLESADQVVELARLPNYVAAGSLLIGSGPSEPFAFRTDPPPPSDPAIAMAIRQRSRDVWGASATPSPDIAALGRRSRARTEPAVDEAAQIAARTDLVRLLSAAAAEGVGSLRSGASSATARSTGAARRASKGIRPLSQDLVKRALDGRELRYRTGDQGDLYLEFERDPESDVQLTLRVVVGGSDDTVLTFRVSADKSVPAERNSELLASLNEWHTSRFWPMAFAVAKDDDESTLQVVCEHSLDLSAGTSEAHVQEQYRLALTTSARLFQWLHQEKALI